MENVKVDGFTAEEWNTNVLDAVDLATAKEDKVCIQRDHKTGQISWRFATPQADPLGMMMRTLALQIMYDGGVFARLDALEKRVAELEEVVTPGD